jgi:hypothetical protein
MMRLFPLVLMCSKRGEDDERNANGGFPSLCVAVHQKRRIIQVVIVIVESNPYYRNAGPSNAERTKVEK